MLVLVLCFHYDRNTRHTIFEGHSGLPVNVLLTLYNCIDHLLSYETLLECCLAIL